MTGFVRLLCMLLVLGSGICCMPFLSYAANDSSVILSIDVKGNHFVEKQAILARMGTRVGQQLNRKQLGRDVRKLFKTGFFSDVGFTGTRTSHGINLVCHVKEYPLIAKLTIEGNNAHASKDLKRRMKLKPGAFFNPKNKQIDYTMLRNGYLKDGYYQNNIQFISTPVKNGRVDVLVKIHEGGVTRISRILFIGNHAYSGSQLNHVIASRQTDLLNTIMKRDVFHKKRFGADVQLLQQYYMNHGYLDMKVDSDQLDLSMNKSNFSMTFSIHEGIKYMLDKLDVQGDIVPDKATLMNLIKLKTGDAFSLAQMRETIAAITDRVGDEGYAFASVTPLLQRDVDAHTVSIAFDIDKGKQVYVERIEITGNQKTDDTVLRRMIKQPEGALYQGTLLKHSKQRLGRGAMVKDVRVSLVKTTTPSQVNMKVKIKEQKTGSISGGIGYSQRQKVILTAKISENNLLGKGYRLSLNGVLGKITQNITGRFVNPYFLGSNISASMNFSKRKSNPIYSLTYTTSQTAGGVGFGIPITLNLSYGINYNYSSTYLSGVPASLSSLIAAQEGLTTIGEITQSLSWDSRDRLMNPRSGQMAYISAGVAGLGGKSRFWNASLLSKIYIPFGKNSDFVLNPSFQYGMIRPLQGRAIPLWRRFSLGGVGSLRGFNSYGVSLRDASGAALGGDSELRASVNMFFPMPYTQTSGLRGMVFVDAGTVWGSVSSRVANISIPSVPFSLSTMRMSAGIGVEWVSPIGPVGLSWAYPIRSQPGDRLKSFQFVVGQSF